MPAPFPIHPTYTGIAIAYRNAAMIADEIMPYASPVGTERFTYFSYPIEEALTLPDTAMGRRSTANTIEVTATEVEAKVVDHALSDLIPQSDLDNAPAGYDPRAHAAETVTDLMVLRREVDVAGIVFNAANYPAANKVQLAGVTQMSHADCDPFQLLWDALDIPLMRPNVATMGQSVWTKIATHPKLIAKLYGAASTIGKASRAHLAEALEIDKILVGAARVNTAKKGQAAVLDRAWGKHLSLNYVNPLANNERGMTWGMTVPMGERSAVRVIPEPKIGIGGSERIQVEQRRKEVIVAANTGYFFQDAIA